MSNLLVEIGNTALKAAWADGLTLGRTFRYQGENTVDHILSIASEEKPEILTVASVRNISEKEENMLRAACGELLLIDPSRNDVIGDYGLPSYLSPDRCACLVALRNLFSGKACTLFDFGTTISVDFLASDGGYEGGNISLGCRTRFKALNRYSRTLPLVDTPSDPVFPGTSLKGSIESGIISGIMFEIDGYIRRKPDNIVVFTGGDANYFVKKMKNSIFVVCNLSLMGLSLITDKYVRKNH